MSLTVKAFGRTDVGLVRTGNEDFLHLDEDNALFVVCDGMGGHQAGEVASMLASNVIRIAFNELSDEILAEDKLNVGRALPDRGNLLLRSIRLANRAIHNKAETERAHAGMGTTVVAFVLDGDMMSVAHAGDSRAYRLDQRKLTPLTDDHSWVAEIQKQQNISEEEASKMIGKNVITRALGVRDTIEVDYRLLRVNAGDKFILCSDGLCGFADDDEIFAVARRARDDNEKIVNDLIQMANDRGGMDNVTIVVVEIVQTDISELPEVEPFTLEPESPEQLVAEDALVNKIKCLLSEQDIASSETPSDPGANKTVLFLIFAFFVLIAAVIVYFTGN